jgi:hypothetical protein
MPKRIAGLRRALVVAGRRDSALMDILFGPPRIDDD